MSDACGVAIGPNATPQAIGPNARRLRRELGAIAWCALEVIAEQAVADGATLIARVGVRRLASEMDVATNTAARAVRALLDRGLLVRSQRRARSGRFERGLYELVVPADALVIVRVVPQQNPGTTSTKANRTRRLPVEQLALLPE